MLELDVIMSGNYIVDSLCFVYMITMETSHSFVHSYIKKPYLFLHWLAEFAHVNYLLLSHEVPVLSTDCQVW